MSPSAFFKISKLIITTIIAILNLPISCIAWSIDPDCAGYPVAAQITSALNMAIYASKRAGGATPFLGTELVDLLGAPNGNDPITLNLVQTWFENVIDAARVPGPGGILFHCTDAYLTTISAANRKFSDNTRANIKMQVIAPQPPAGVIPTETACGGFAKAFTYPAGIQQVIILCSDSPAGALTSSSSLGIIDAFRSSGNLKLSPGIEAKGLDMLGMYLSTMILHELMHAASFAKQLGELQPAQFPAILPADTVGGAPSNEIYQYTPISGKQLGATTSFEQPSANKLQHNADSFSLLAASWFLPFYAWVNGECKTVRASKQPPLVYPNTPAAPAEFVIPVIASPPPTRFRIRGTRRVYKESYKAGRFYDE